MLSRPTASSKKVSRTLASDFRFFRKRAARKTHATCSRDADHCGDGTTVSGGDRLRTDDGAGCVLDAGDSVGDAGVASAPRLHRVPQSSSSGSGTRLTTAADVVIQMSTPAERRLAEYPFLLSQPPSQSRPSYLLRSIRGLGAHVPLRQTRSQDDVASLFPFVNPLYDDTSPRPHISRWVRTNHPTPLNRSRSADASSSRE
eukprot:Rmarinus@m.26340